MGKTPLTKQCRKKFIERKIHLLDSCGKVCKWCREKIQWLISPSENSVLEKQPSDRYDKSCGKIYKHRKIYPNCNRYGILF